MKKLPPNFWLVVGFFALLSAAVTFYQTQQTSSAPSRYESSSSQSDAPAPADTPQLETTPMQAYDYTVSTKDRKDVLCFSNGDQYSKAMDEAVNHDTEAEQRTLAETSSIPSGSRVHVIGVDIFKGYADLRYLKDGSECVASLTDDGSTYYHDRGQENP